MFRRLSRIFVRSGRRKQKSSGSDLQNSLYKIIELTKLNKSRLELDRKLYSILERTLELSDRDLNSERSE